MTGQLEFLSTLISHSEMSGTRILFSVIIYCDGLFWVLCLWEVQTARDNCNLSKLTLWVTRFHYELLGTHLRWLERQYAEAVIWTINEIVIWVLYIEQQLVVTHCLRSMAIYLEVVISSLTVSNDDVGIFNIHSSVLKRLTVVIYELLY